MITTNEILKEILRAEHRIRPYTLVTPLMHSLYLSAESGANVYLKLENEQHTGSFKARGSMNKTLALQEEGSATGIVTASTGNHGKGIGRAVKQVGMKGIVFLPTSASPEKEKAIAEYGVETRRYGDDSVYTEEYAKRFAKENEMVYISPYNDPQIIGGQGTIGVEIMQQLPSVDAVFVTVGGGGLISGVGTYIKATRPSAKIIGCQPENSPEMSMSIQQGHIVEPVGKPTLSDTSAGGIEEGAITFPLCKELVDEFVLVNEKEIAASMKLMADEHHKIVEGAAAVAVASLLKQGKKYKGQNVIIIICGGNVASDVLKSIL